MFLVVLAFAAIEHEQEQEQEQDLPEGSSMTVETKSALAESHYNR